jgi:lactoylglutathione lyase
VSIREHWHAGVTVSDLDNAIAFYSDGLGLELRHRQVQENDYTAVMLGYPACRIEIAQMRAASSPQTSGHLIELIAFEQPAPIVDPGPMHRVSTVHVALCVDHIDGTAQRAVHHGATLVSEVLDISGGINKGGKVVWMRDPDGVLIELVQPPDSPTREAQP